MTTSLEPQTTLVERWKETVEQKDATTRVLLLASAKETAATLREEAEAATAHRRTLRSPSSEWHAYENTIRRRAANAETLNRGVRACLVHTPTSVEVLRMLAAGVPAIRAGVGAKTQLRVVAEHPGALALAALPKEVLEELTLSSNFVPDYSRPEAWEGSWGRKYHRDGKALVTMYETRKFVVVNGRNKELKTLWAAPEALNDAQAGVFAQLRNDGMEHPAALEAAALL